MVAAGENRIQTALQSILQCAQLSESAAGRVRFMGADPVFPTPYRIGTAAAAALGAVGIAIAQLRELQSGVRAGVEVDVRAAAASLRSNKYIHIDGKRVPSPEYAVAGFYPAAGGRWTYLHCSLPPHEQAVLRLLGEPADRARVAAAVLRWQPLALEQAVDEAGGCAPAVRTRDEWSALPNTVAMGAEPLVEVRKIADTAPIPLPGGERPLSGIRALDLTRVLAGPTSARLLAEYGADVIKITCEQHPDFAHFAGDTSYAKRHATLDIKSQRGHEQFDSLVRGCDVFCQAYRPGALAGLGYGPDQVTRLRPGVIYASLNTFGFTGPWRERRGFDTVVQAASGMAHISGRSREPKFTPVSALDYVSGYLLAFGVMVALARRSQQGGSYCVNVALARTCEWLTAMGLFDVATVDATPAELSSDELRRLLIEVPTPLGRLTRLRPVINFSDGAFQDLPPWSDKPAATWGN